MDEKTEDGRSIAEKYGPPERVVSLQARAEDRERKRAQAEREQIERDTRLQLRLAQEREAKGAVCTWMTVPTKGGSVDVHGLPLVCGARFGSVAEFVAHVRMHLVFDQADTRVVQQVIRDMEKASHHPGTKGDGSSAAERNKLLENLKKRLPKEQA